MQIRGQLPQHFASSAQSLSVVQRAIQISIMLDGGGHEPGLLSITIVIQKIKTNLWNVIC